MEHGLQLNQFGVNNSSALNLPISSEREQAQIVSTFWSFFLSFWLSHYSSQFSLFSLLLRLFLPTFQFHFFSLSSRFFLPTYFVFYFFLFPFLSLLLYVCLLLDVSFTLSPSLNFTILPTLSSRYFFFSRIFFFYFILLTFLSLSVCLSALLYFCHYFNLSIFLFF